MFLFLKLYLGHLIGDFVLQVEEIYNLKVKSLWGHLYHVLTHAVAYIFLCYPYFKGQPFLWIFIFIICIIHFGQDVLKYILVKKYPQFGFLLFMLDQFFHLAFLSTIFFFPIHKTLPEIATENELSRIYLDSNYTLFAIAFILATFATSYMLFSFRINFIKGSRPLHFITSFEMYHAIFERGLITTLLIFTSSPMTFLTISLTGLVRLPFEPLRNLFDFTLSFGFAIFWGFLFRQILFLI
jgi:hypothetical protein